AIQIPVIEVHISNVASRETIRHTSLIAPVCQGTIAGFGLNSYFLAAQAIIMG
ncbi:MAG: type II 3-dehydroquinate dehydratase, partial [Duncaniella sp.]|nr:type II 3-dehydroquinate dehydratase [Duncaniella sp.]